MLDAEMLRRSVQESLNAAAAERKKLEEEYGQVWDSDQLRAEFEVIGFLAPIVSVRRLSDGVKGSLFFQHSPRFYFDWSAD